MPPLYKRFVPAKPPTVSAAEPAKAAAPQPSAKPQQLAAPENKRKRERTAEEIADRKAKKLKKKGIEGLPGGGITEVQDVPREVGWHSLSESGATEGGATVANDKPAGEFAHIKNAKKRHKLEKEARKAAKRGAKAEVQRDSGNTVQAHSDTVEDGAANKDAVREEDNITANVGDGGHMDANGEPSTAKKPKKRRKEKQSSQLADRDDVIDATRNARALVDGEPDEEVARDGEVNGLLAYEDGQHVGRQLTADEAGTIMQPKKRRHRLEAALLQSSKDVDHEGSKEEDEHLRKHGGVISKFQKSTKLAQRQLHGTEQDQQQPPEQPILRDIAPIPMPEKAPTPDFVPDSSSLPKWLAQPQVVPNDTRASFEQVGLDEKAVSYLSALGLKDALPVQQALIPLLIPPGIAGASFLPGSEPVLPDLAVSAATGSGKTIAYLLPIVEALRHSGHGIGRLQALIVVPTRELVMQVAAVAESLARKQGITVGMATGSGKLKDEQERLIRRSQRYDPERYADMMKRAHRRQYPPDEDDEEEFSDYLDELENEDSRENQRLDDAISGLAGHIPTYHSMVDILVCTPGRLLEHISGTLGFTLAYIKWLVLDEADKLLDQQYDGFLETVNAELTRERTLEEQDARERYLRSKGVWNEQQERRVRKVVLSATMKKDISLLSHLHLFRPRMVVLRGTTADDRATTLPESATAADGVKEIDSGFELPQGLVEFCVPVGDGSEKPLFLIKLLEEKILFADPSFGSSTMLKPREDEDGEYDLSSDSTSESDLDSISSSELSSSSSEPSSDDDSESDEASKVPAVGPDDEAMIHPARAALLASRPTQVEAPTVLTFASSTESAHRLAHLLKNLRPEWAPLITTLTKNEPSRSMHAFTNPKAAAQPSITISTDRASRGLDTLAANRAVTHVIQYDVPRSVTSYVHRVGRTARAGRSGEAWTLYTHNEARWFVQEITRAAHVRRPQAVEKTKLVVEDEGMKEKYQEVLAGMREEVFGGHGASRGKKG